MSRQFWENVKPTEKYSFHATEHVTIRLLALSGFWGSMARGCYFVIRESKKNETIRRAATMSRNKTPY
jgi:hypothetical protein